MKLLRKASAITAAILLVFVPPIMVIVAGIWAAYVLVDNLMLGDGKENDP